MVGVCFNVQYLHVPLGVQVKIAMVGKYTGLSDAYLSVLKVNCLLQDMFI